MDNLYPCNVVSLWIRPRKSQELKKCLFCENAATHQNNNYTPHALEIMARGGGILDFNAEYDKAARLQVKGDFSVYYPQDLCRACTIHFADVLLGRSGPIKGMLNLADRAKRQKSIELSQAIFLRIASYEDEGATYAVSCRNGLSELKVSVREFKP